MALKITPTRARHHSHAVPKRHHPLNFLISPLSELAKEITAYGSLTDRKAITGFSHLRPAENGVDPFFEHNFWIIMEDFQKTILKYNEF